MAKTNIETQIEEAAASFAVQIVEAVKNATLQELMGLQGEAALAADRPRRGRKPGQKPDVEKKVDGRRNRIVKNYPKCAYPKCNKNRFPRGKGFCGEHYRLWQAGKIKAADAYKKKG
jgi:hypothetical protein